MTFRALDRARDRAALADLFDRAADYIALERGVPPDDAMIDELFDDAPPGLGAEDVAVYGAFGAGRLQAVSALAFGWPEPDDAYLGLLLVAAEARGAGLGARVLAASEEVCRGNGMRRFLLAVLDANPRARAFWELAGFEAVIEGIPVQMGLRDHTAARMMKRLGGA